MKLTNEQIKDLLAKHNMGELPHRVAFARAIEAAVMAQGEPCGYDETTGNCTRNPCCNPAPVNAQEADNDKVICPKCVHQFRAIPVNVQDRISELEAQNEQLLEAVEGERKRIVNLLMIQHEMAKERHNYWHVAAQLIQADIASNT